jgi:hypothetical protein
MPSNMPLDTKDYKDVSCFLTVPIIAKLYKNIYKEFISYNCEISSIKLGHTYLSSVSNLEGKFLTNNRYYVSVNISKETALNLKEVWLIRHPRGSEMEDWGSCIVDSPDFAKISQQWKNMLSDDLLNSSSSLSSNVDDSVENKINKILSENYL